MKNRRRANEKRRRVNEKRRRANEKRRRVNEKRRRANEKRRRVNEKRRRDTTRRACTGGGRNRIETWPKLKHTKVDDALNKSKSGQSSFPLLILYLRASHPSRLPTSTLPPFPTTDAWSPRTIGSPSSSVSTSIGLPPPRPRLPPPFPTPSPSSPQSQVDTPSPSTSPAIATLPRHVPRSTDIPTHPPFSESSPPGPTLPGCRVSPSTSNCPPSALLTRAFSV
jgi:hypothetical protein